MSATKLLKSAEALLACERGLIAAKAGTARVTHREAALQLEASIAEFGKECADGGLCRRVLVAVDESEPANWAVRVGINLARLADAKLALVHVIHDEMAMTPAFAMPREDLALERRHAGEELLHQAKSRAPEELETETILLIGDPAQQIVATARRWNADLIVLGTHGRTGVAHMLIGSTAECVVRLAPCPVLTVGHDPGEQDIREVADLSHVAERCPQCYGACQVPEPHAVV